MPDHLVEWDRIDVRIRGERLAAIVGDVVRDNKLPIEYLALEFLPGVLRIEGKIRKTVSIPFRLAVPAVHVANGTARVEIEEMSSYLGIPIPRFLFGMIEDRTKAGGISYDSETRSLRIELDRFLPSNVEVEVEQIRLVDGGIAVTLGKGGADLPPAGGNSWKSRD